MTSVVARFAGLVGVIALASGCATPLATAARPVVTAGSCRLLIDHAPAVDSPRVPSLAWYGADPDSATAHAESCATVGPGFHEGDRAAGGSRPVPFEDLAVVSWNVHVGGGDLVGLVTALRTGRFTSGRPVRHFVLLVQEAYRAGHDVPEAIAGVDVPGRIAPGDAEGKRIDVRAAARAAGLHVFYVPLMRNGAEPGTQAEDRGNAILSTLPLTDLTAIELPYARQRRVAAAATIAGIDEAGALWRLRVVSAHLDATAGAESLWLFSSGLRERQAAHLLAALGDGMPTIVGADLNTWAGGPREPAVTVLQRAFPDTAVPAQPTFRLGWTLDYVFTRLPPDWRSDRAVVGDRFGSDHHPIVATLRPQAGTLTP